MSSVISMNGTSGYDTCLKKHPLVIVSSADENYALPLMVSMYSALSNLTYEGEVLLYLIDGGIRPQTKQRIDQVLRLKHLNISIEWIQPDFGLIDKLKISGHINLTTYFRVLVPWLLPTSLKKAIYLDSDLVIEGNLQYIWEQDLGDKLALGCQDYLNPYVSCPEALLDTYQELNLAKDAVYCNVGVMVIDLDGWRREDVSSKVIELVQKYQFNLMDQDGLNAAISGRWGLLDGKWNVTLSSVNCYGHFLNLPTTEVDSIRAELLSSPYIIHFTSRDKPWHYGTSKCSRHFLYYHQAQVSRFFHYLQKSGWYQPFRAIQWVGMRRLWLLVTTKVPLQLDNQIRKRLRAFLNLLRSRVREE